MTGIITPPTIVSPFGINAAGGTLNNIPQTQPAPGVASYDKGFPPETMIELNAGGIAPQGQDFNGILYALSAWVAYQAAGQTPRYTAAVSTYIGGYPMGTILQSTDGISQWKSLVGNNTTDPDSGGAANWLLYSGAGQFTLTLTGCTTSPTGTMFYRVADGQVLATLPAVSAVSNATTCTLTGLIAKLFPKTVTQGCGLGSLLNGGVVVANGLAQITTAGGIVLALGGTNTGFQNTLSKGVPVSQNLSWFLGT